MPVLFAFLLPFGLNLSVLVIFWFVTSWFNFDKTHFNKGLKNKWFLLLFSFFIIHIVSAILSDNQKGALNAIELKLGFLGFPYFYFLFKIERSTVKRVISAFISGCLIALLACLGRAFWLYLLTGENHFYYTKFSYFMHAGYFSMYMCFAIVITFIVYPVWYKKDRWISAVKYAFVVMFVIGVFLCASKIGIITFGITALLIPLILFKDTLTIKGVVLSLTLLVGLAFLLYVVLPTPFARITNALSSASTTNIDRTSSESTTVRILIWGECVDLIKSNLMTGVGAGDVNDVLQERYKEKGLSGALEHNLNAHNQYFQTFIGLGLIGFIILVTSTLGAMIYGFVKRNWILVLFTVIIILNFLVESMLQTQAGNLFFGFFLCLLLTVDTSLYSEEI